MTLKEKSRRPCIRDPDKTLFTRVDTITGEATASFHVDAEGKKIGCVAKLDFGIFFNFTPSMIISLDKKS